LLQWRASWFCAVSKLILLAWSFLQSFLWWVLKVAVEGEVDRSALVVILIFVILIFVVLVMIFIMMFVLFILVVIVMTWFRRGWLQRCWCDVLDRDLYLAVHHLGFEFKMLN
jgi:hypothetical protein